MSYFIMFNIREVYVADNELPDYSWWDEFVDKLFTIGESFEIRCWQKDVEGIESAMQFANQVPNNTTSEIVFKGKITDSMLQVLHNDYLSKKGILKWFTICVRYQNGEMLSCEHYGTEMYFSNTTKERAAEVKKWAIIYPYLSHLEICNSEDSEE